MQKESHPLEDEAVVDPVADEILGTLQLMIDAGDITPEDAAELFQSGALED